MAFPCTQGCAALVGYVLLRCPYPAALPTDLRSFTGMHVAPRHARRAAVGSTSHYGLGCGLRQHRRAISADGPSVPVVHQLL
eukprot:scaffold307_cov390-Prasinococcus_capsulatus_cf.AAC.7